MYHHVPIVSIKDSDSRYPSRSIPIIKGQDFEIDNLMLQLVKQQYIRNDLVVQRGSFRLKGDTLDIFPVYEETIFRIEFFGDEVENISRIGRTLNQWVELFNRYLKGARMAGYNLVLFVDNERAWKDIYIDVMLERHEGNIGPEQRQFNKRLPG